MKKNWLLIALSFLSASIFANGYKAPMVVDSTCAVSISLDSSNVGLILTAEPEGTAPFTYLWSTGEVTQSIIPSVLDTGYCVTVIDAEGCEAWDCFWEFPVDCATEIYTNSSGGLVATGVIGNAPFTYLWSSGETTATISPIDPGLYCVTTTDNDGCESSACYWSSGTTCDVQIYQDTSILGSGDVTLTAVATGQAPFTYQWDVQNYQTQSITVPANGTYCVTITADNGCTASTCFTVLPTGCEVSIYEGDSLGITILDAIAGPAGQGPFTYEWSNGETGQYIAPNAAGTYCVTITSNNGCTASDCYFYNPPTGTTIQGYIYLPDSLNAQNWDCVVELYQLDANGSPVLTATENVSSASNSGYFAHYVFDDLDNGDYIVLAYIDPNDPLSASYLPTYYQYALLWNEATVVEIPSNQWLFNITLDDGQMLTGDGTISGVVSDGDGLAPNANDRGPGDPLEGVTILLFDESESSIMHTYTDANGKYNFGDLPYGTYKIVVEIVGIEQGVRWVTLSPDEPTVSGVNFAVNENEIINGIAELVNDAGFHVYPNPVSGVLNLTIESSANFAGVLTISELRGATILAQPKNIVKGEQQFSLDLNDLPTGIYFLQLSTGNEVISRKVVKD